MGVKFDIYQVYASKEYIGLSQFFEYLRETLYRTRPGAPGSGWPRTRKFNGWFSFLSTVNAYEVSIIDLFEGL